MGIRDGNLEASIHIDNKTAMRAVRDFNREVVRTGGVAKTASSQIQRAKKLETQVIEGNARIRKRADRQIEAAERRSATFGLRGIARLRAQERELVQLARASGRGARAIDRIGRAFELMRRRVEASTKASQRFRKEQRSVEKAGAPRGGGALGGAGLLALGSRAAGAVGVTVGLGAALIKLTDFVGESIRASAKAEQLGISLDVVAKRFNVSREAMTLTERALRRMSLTQVQARDAIQIFTRAGARQNEILTLTEAALDAAARRSISVDEATRRLAEGVQKSSPQFLDELGIIVKLAEAQKEYKKELGLSEKAKLTAAQSSRALIRNLVKQAEKGGEFAATLNTLAGKSRDADQTFGRLQETVGKIFTPIAVESTNLYQTALESIERVIGRLFPLQSRLNAEVGKLGRIRPIDPKRADELRRLAIAQAEGTQTPGKPEAVVALSDEQKRAQRQAGELLRRSQVARLTGLERINAERRRQLELLGKTPQAIRDIDRAFDLQIASERKRIGERAGAVLSRGRDLGAAQRRDALVPASLDQVTSRFRKDLAAEKQHLEQKLAIEKRIQTAGFDHEQLQLRQSRDAQLSQLARIGNETVNQKVLLERKKLDIEVQFLKRSADLDKAVVRAKTLNAIAENEELRRVLLRQQRQQLEALDQTTQAAILTAQRRTATEQARVISDHNQRIFDDLKRSAEGVFDALLTRSRGFFDTIRNLFRTALLTPIKEVLSSRLAAALSGLFGGQARAGGGGLGSVLGSLGLGGISRPGAPGGTPGFAGPVASARGGALSFGGLGGGGLKGLFSFGRKTGVSGIDEFLPGGLSGALQSNGSALIGAGLAVAGLRRGGVSGLAMTTAGGALIGARFGGPIGAAIGAGIGALAGTIRLFVRGARDKVREKIRSLYGIDVRDKGILSQIVNTAKTAFGGNLDLAIRSPGVRDLLELFAMSTGQSFSGFNARVTPVSLVQRSGGISQLASFRGGRPQVFRSSIPTISPGVSTRNVTVLQLDGRATTNFLQGQAVEAIANEPRAVQSSAIQAQKSSFGRRESAATLLQPSAVLA